VAAGHIWNLINKKNRKKREKVIPSYQQSAPQVELLTRAPEKNMIAAGFQRGGDRNFREKLLNL